jgi:hypothetical protein
MCIAPVMPNHGIDVHKSLQQRALFQEPLIEVRLSATPPILTPARAFGLERWFLRRLGHLSSFRKLTYLGIRQIRAPLSSLLHSTRTDWPLMYSTSKYQLFCA